MSSSTEHTNENHHHGGHHHEHEHEHHHGHDHHQHHPSDKLDHLDKQAESHAATPEFFKLNQYIFSLMEPKIPSSSSNKDNDNDDEGIHILDFGCGPGRLSILMAQQLPHVASVLGTDISDGMLSHAEHFLQLETSADPNFMSNKVTFLKTNRMPDQELQPLFGTKDVVVMSFVLGHIAPKSAGEEVLAIVAKTLKPGGKFILAEFLYTNKEEEKQQPSAPSGENNDHHGHEGGHDHGHGHEHHQHHDHSHSHSHHHGDHNNNNNNNADDHHEKSHHGGHVAYSKDEIRNIFEKSGLEIQDEENDFLPFEFEWGGRILKSIMAVGTKKHD